MNFAGQDLARIGSETFQFLGTLDRNQTNGLLIFCGSAVATWGVSTVVYKFLRLKMEKDDQNHRHLIEMVTLMNLKDQAETTQ